jgi:hypothetical protein
MTKEEESILNTDYSKKLNKRQLESLTGDLIQSDRDTAKGDLFGIIGPAVKEHAETWGSLRGEDSQFIMVEKEKKVYEEMIPKWKKLKDPNVLLVHGDVFDTINRIRSNKKHTFNFIYGHLDFCKTAHVLKYEFDLYKNLCWLAKWKKLNDIFWLDVSFSTRTDNKKDSYDNSYEMVMENEIPYIFSRYGWKVINIRPNKDKKTFANEYREPQQCPMVNALYKFIRKPKKDTESKNAYFNKGELKKYLKQTTENGVEFITKVRKQGE